MTDMWGGGGGGKSMGHVRPGAVYCYFVYRCCLEQINIPYFACSKTNFYFVLQTAVTFLLV